MCSRNSSSSSGTGNVKRKLVMFDLGCGLGGASAAMRDRGWTVYSIDRERDVRADRYCDLRSILALPQGLDLIWCSTSCQQFTVTALPWPTCVRARKPIDLSVEHHVRELIENARPRFWLVENVVASRKWLTPIFGPLRCYTGGHCIWGNLPLLIPQVKSFKTRVGMKNCSGGDRKRHLKRSLIQYEMSLAVAETVERLSEGSLCQNSA